MKNRRQFTRIKFDAAVTLCQPGLVCHAQVIDISLKGLLVQTPKQYEFVIDKSIDCVIYLCEKEAITMQVALIHSSSNYLGFKVIDIDFESIRRLQKLIKSLLNDPNACHRVLKELLQQAS